jgi:hypothetical protein
MSPAIGAVHAGDWLMKLLVMMSVLTLWRISTVGRAAGRDRRNAAGRSTSSP